MSGLTGTSWNPKSDLKPKSGPKIRLDLKKYTVMLLVMKLLVADKL